jgi:hypothetical protein
MITYSLQKHLSSGEVYALKYDPEYNIIGVCGPLAYDDQDAPLDEYEYNDEDAEWAEQQEWGSPIRDETEPSAIAPPRRTT